MDNVDIIFWAVLAVLAFVGELLSVSFLLLFFSLGALVGLLMAVLGLGVAVQVGGFIVASVLSAVLLRPTIMRRISLRASERYVRRQSIAGRSGVVTSSIEPGASGTVRIGSGEFWTARAVHPEQKIEPGTRIRVVDMDGVTALVETMGAEEGEKP